MTEEDSVLAVEAVEESPLDVFHEECGVFGVYRHPEPTETETRVQLGLRNAFSATPADVARAMVGETAVSVYGLDRERLAQVATRIGAITPERLATPLDNPPEEWAILARSQTVFPEYHLANSG